MEFAFPRLAEAGGVLCGEEVVSVRSWGKAILIAFANGLTVYCHSQLYGRWYICESGNTPVTRRSLRLRVANRENAALLYSASEIDLLEHANLDAHPFLHKLGPDVLGPGLGPVGVQRRMEDRRFARRNLGALLLDQTFVAGIGNYLRSEILFFSGLHPSRTAAQCTPPEARRLATSMLRISQRAYRRGGITNDARRVAAQKRRGARRRDYRHAVYGRVGRACLQCGGTIERVEHAGRNLFLCPVCQPEMRV